MAAMGGDWGQNVPRTSNMGRTCLRTRKTLGRRSSLAMEYKATPLSTSVFRSADSQTPEQDWDGRW